MKIPQPISAFVHAINIPSAADLLSTFNDFAVITDEGHEYIGIAAIKEWFEEKCVRANVRLEPVKTVDSSERAVVTMKVEGTFDKTGLPDPLLLDFHFKIDARKVSALDIRFPDSAD